MDINKIKQKVISEKDTNPRYICINGKNIMLNRKVKNKSLRAFVEEFI
jgi:hypothetical protein